MFLLSCGECLFLILRFVLRSSFGFSFFRIGPLEKSTPLRYSLSSINNAKILENRAIFSVVENYNEKKKNYVCICIAWGGEETTNYNKLNIYFGWSVLVGIWEDYFAVTICTIPHHLKTTFLEPNLLYSFIHSCLLFTFFLCTIGMHYIVYYLYWDAAI